MTTVTLSPILNGWQGFGTTGLPLNAGKLYTYAAGGSTPVSTYTDNTGGTPNSNPIVLGADGRPPYEIWIVPGNSYKFVVKDSLGNSIATYDNVIAPVVSGSYVSSTSLTMAPNRLLGRTTAGTGAAEEISTGTGLSISAGVLSTSGINASNVVYTHSGTGAVATTVKAELDSFGFNVKDFGAYGDGSTTVNAGAFVVGRYYSILTVGSTNFMSIGASANTIGVTFQATGVGTGSGTARGNDTAAFVAAIAAASAVGGGVVNVPIGEYLLDTFTLTHNVSLVGMMPGPFDYITPATAVAPTLNINSYGTNEFILSNGSNVISDLLFFDPNQVSPTTATPTVKPPMIHIYGGSPGSVFRCTIVNAYVGIKIDIGRCTIQDCKIGAYRTGISVDRSEDFTNIIDNFIEPLYNTYLALSTPQLIDTWVLNNGIGIESARCDAINIDGLGIFIKYCGLSFQQSPNYSPPTYCGTYGRVSNVDIDMCAYGVDCACSNELGGGINIVNMNVGRNSTGVGTNGLAAVLCSNINSLAHPNRPSVQWTGGSVRDEVWSAGQVVLRDTGPYVAYLRVSNVTLYRSLTTEVCSTLVKTLSAPAVPSTTVDYQNVFPFDCTVHITGGTVTIIKVNGATTGLTSGTIRLNVNDIVNITYSVAPTWVWCPV